MSRRATRHLVVVAALGMLAGCASGGSTTETTAAVAPSSVSSSTRAELCTAYGSLKTSFGDLASAPLDDSATAEQYQQQVQDLQGRADTVKDDLATMQRESDGGPADAVIGALNEKADALSESLTEAVAGAQSEVGPKVTAAQAELETAYTKVTTTMDKLCPPN